MKSPKEQHLFKIEIFYNKCFTVTFDQFNASLLNKSINFLYDPKHLNASVVFHPLSELL